MPWTRPQAAEEFAEKVCSRPSYPQRLEAAVDAAALTARVELVPFPKPVRFPNPVLIGVFPQAVKPRLWRALTAPFGSAQGRL